MHSYIQKHKYPTMHIAPSPFLHKWGCTKQLHLKEEARLGLEEDCWLWPSAQLLLFLLTRGALSPNIHHLLGNPKPCSYWTRFPLRQFITQAWPSVPLYPFPPKKEVYWNVLATEQVLQADAQEIPLLPQHLTQLCCGIWKAWMWMSHWRMKMIADGLCDGLFSLCSSSPPQPHSHPGSSVLDWPCERKALEIGQCLHQTLFFPKGREKPEIHSGWQGKGKGKACVWEGEMGWVSELGDATDDHLLCGLGHHSMAECLYSSACLNPA